MNPQIWHRKLVWVGIAVVAAYGVILVRASLLQMGHCTRSRQQQISQSVRRVWIGPRRGTIYDRNRVPLNVTRQTLSLCVDLDVLREPRDTRRRLVERVVGLTNRLAPLLDERAVHTAVTPARVAEQVYTAPALPVVIWQDLPPDAVARWQVHDEAFPAVRLVPIPVRHYLLPDKGFHVRGLAGASGPDAETKTVYHYCLPGLAGRTGVERLCDERLRGTPGEAVLQVDARGFRRGIVRRQAALSGSDVTMALDIRLQCFAEEALEGVTGAIVILDPNTGDVLALASSPAGRLDCSAAEFADLASRVHEKPLLNRAISQVYPVGSCFKPIVAERALRAGVVTPDEVFVCPGYYQIGRHRVRCWKPGGHGRLTFTQAIAESCNTVFCEVASRLPPEEIADSATEFGLGRRTGIGLPGEAAGLVPSPEWKRQAFTLEPSEQVWRPGDTLNFGLGQGYLCATLVQMGCAVAILANGGTSLRPRLILDDSPPEVLGRANVSPAALGAVRRGMEEVIEGKTGTGRRARVEGVRMGGKTGSAQAGTPEKPRTIAWMILYAPADAPRYAVAMLVEDGVSGGETVAPRLGRLMSRVFAVEGRSAELLLAESAPER